MQPRDTNPAQGFKATERQLEDDWSAEEAYWRTAWQTRPYASADRSYEYSQQAYRYGFESARTLRGRDWYDAEPELESGWKRRENGGQSTWEQVKDAVRDAWNRVTNR
jgi:hypothetical protein